MRLRIGEPERTASARKEAVAAAGGEAEAEAGKSAEAEVGKSDHDFVIDPAAVDGLRFPNYDVPSILPEVGGATAALG